MGPLRGIKVVELAGMGPGPHAAMVLADWGAEVVRIARPDSNPAELVGVDLRGRRLVEADLKDPAQLAEVRSLVAQADVLIEGYRPGVAERLGLGPEDSLARNERLVYGRVTGWGQSGPWAMLAGHDINYLAVTGVLDAVGPKEAPFAPVNFIGDFGGGSMLLVAGIMAALVERGTSGKGQVVDTAMTDGIGILSHMMWSMRAAGDWQESRQSNLLDGGAPFYRVYTCSDGRHLAVGAIEPQFYARFVEVIGLDAASLPNRDAPETWPALQEIFAAAIGKRTRDEWAARFDGVDACVTPVLSMTEATVHPQMQERHAFRGGTGAEQPASAPRFGRTTAAEGLPEAAQTTLGTVLHEWSGSLATSL